MAPLVIVRNQASCQNLVESTKLERIKHERIKHDSKSARRKERDEKKEKRQHKKEKQDKSRKRSHKHSSSKAVSKKVSDECDQLEKSGLTEELEEPQNHLGYLSDGSQNSKKRRRDDSPPAIESRIKAAPVAGKPLRIRLIFKRPKVDESPSKDLPVCSTSGTVSLDNRETVVKAVENSVLRVSEPQEIQSLPSTSAGAVVETKKVAIVSDAESLDNREKVAQAAVPSSVPCLEVSEAEENLPSTSAVALAESKKRKKHRPSKEDRYNALFDNWDPPSLCLPALEIDSSEDDDDWLFGKRTQKLNSRAAVQEMNTPLQNKAGEDSCWSRARFLPEVGIYSLPYTVPF